MKLSYNKKSKHLKNKNNQSKISAINVFKSAREGKSKTILL